MHKKGGDGIEESWYMTVVTVNKNQEHLEGAFSADEGPGQINGNLGVLQPLHLP